MAEPEFKDEAVEKKLIETFGHDRRVTIKQDVCVPPPIGCGGPATEFKDEASRREFRISGLCQTCQDTTWEMLKQLEDQEET